MEEEILLINSVPLLLKKGSVVAPSCYFITTL